MPTNLKLPAMRRAGVSMSRNAKILVATAVLCFGILHVVGGTMLRHVPPAPSIESAIAPAGDD